MTTSKELWYLTRGSGAVALLLLTISVSLGVVTSLRVATSRWPRFAIGRIHRNLTLLSIVFVALHVATTIADGYAPIGVRDAIVPFASPYRPVWLGLGTVAFDLLLALVITSLLRRRIGVRLWRAVHWLAYASWPVALVHSLGTGSDPRSSWLGVLAVVCAATVVASALARTAAGPGWPRVRALGAVCALATPLAVFAWWDAGPAQRGWASRAGTPARLLASHRAPHATAARDPLTARPPQTFDAALAGTISQSRGSTGYEHVVMTFALRGGPGGRLRLDLQGTPVDDGVSMTASGVSFVPATTRAVYLGEVTGLDGSIVAAVVRNPTGDALQLTARLSLGPRGAARGRLVAAPVSG